MSTRHPASPITLCAFLAVEALAAAALVVQPSTTLASGLPVAADAFAVPAAVADTPPFEAARASATDKALLVRQPPIAYAFPYTLPGTFAFLTTRGYYLTAIGGGGRATAPTVVTATTTPGSWEQFRIVVNPNNAWDKSFRTAMGNYVTAVNGGGMTTDAIHTDATAISTWERFRMIDLADSRLPTWYALYTSGSHTVTAVGAGGKYDDAIHTDGWQVGSWEEFRPVKCGDLGSGYEYYIVPANNYMLTADDGGGRADSYALTQGYAYGEPDNAQWSRFRLLRQSDGTYALQTSSGVNYLTALGGGGLVQEYVECDTGGWGACLDGVTDIFHTDATQVSSWEKFRIVDMGDCKYAIQTHSGFYFGIYQTSHGMMFTTRRSTVSANEKFEFVMSSLGSPAIIH